MVPAVHVTFRFNPNHTYGLRVFRGLRGLRTLPPTKSILHTSRLRGGGMGAKVQRALGFLVVVVVVVAVAVAVAVVVVVVVVLVVVVVIVVVWYN